MAIDPNLAAALVDVRRAYRLLWSYQRRVLDTIGLIAGEFDTLSFATWQPTDFFPPAKRSVNPGDHWAADLLPLMGADFFYLPQGHDRSLAQKGQWMLAINVTSDSGYQIEEPEPDPGDFEAAEMCESALSIYIVKSLAERPVRWVEDLWDEMEWPEAYPASIPLMPSGLRAFGMKYDLAEFGRSDDLLTAVADFKMRAAADLGIQLTEAQS